MKYKSVFTLTVLIICFTLNGCIQKPPQTSEFTPFEPVELDAVLAIVVDLSGSFHNDWQRDGRAYKLFLDLINQYFTEGMGLESKVVIGQISNSDSFVLFDGTPRELTQRFRSPESLNQFLQESADPQGSKVYRSTQQMLDYLSGLSSVTKNTRVLTVVLSDMQDSESNSEQKRRAGNEMFASLKTYSKTGGGIAFYFVAEAEKSRWRQLLEQADFAPGSYVIEGQLTESPQLPSFE